MEISRKSNYSPPARIETKFADWKKMERLEEEEGGEREHSGTEFCHRGSDWILVPGCLRRV